MFLNLKDKNIIFCLTGSFCTFKSTIFQMKELVKEHANIIPIMSYRAYNYNTKYGKAKEFIEEIEKLTNREIIHHLKDAQLIGSKNMTDILIISPCTGNTLAKLSNGIVDSPVLMAVKSHLKYENPVVIAPSTDDGLSRQC